MNKEEINYFIEYHENEIRIHGLIIHKLKGPMIELCGGCYHKEEKDHSCPVTNRNGHCPIKVYISEWHETENGSWTKNK